MAERSGFFNSVNGDRTYYSKDWAWYLEKFFTNGIFNNGLQVKANNGMSIAVSLGDAFINGYRYNNDSDKAITVANADGVLDRIDNIVLRLDVLDNRKIIAEIVQGTFNEEPTAPVLTRENNIYELRIAKIRIPAGTTEITDDLIEDTRFDDTDCGNVICAIQNPDFTGILKQYKAIWENLLNGKEEDFDSWFEQIKNSYNNWFKPKEEEFNNWSKKQENIFDEWFETIKGKLSGDVAANLQDQVDELEQQISGLSKSYNDLTDKPKINNVELNENITFEDLGMNDAYRPQYIKNYVLNNANWQENDGNGFKYPITVQGITTNHRVNVYPDIADYGKISGTTDTSENTITLYVAEKPEGDITVNLEITIIAEMTI